jgi:predicted aldo/keto reductase-like oxidoreductase
MFGQNCVGRREFIQKTAGFVTSGWVVCCGYSVEEAIRRVGRVPRRELGSSGREISVLIGAYGWRPEVSHAAIHCGVNYWHKAERWVKPESPVDAKRPEVTPPEIIQNRGAHYCEAVVDRIRGNHETGEIDEEAFYQAVKKAVEQTGLRYFDDFKFHFGYHNVEEYKENRAPIRAYERLKKEGLVHHLCISQHSYNGNAKVPGGESAPEILQAIIEDGIYEHAQFFYSFDDSPAVNEILDLARQKGFGTIAMKTARGLGRMTDDEAYMKKFPADTSPHHALARWLTTETKLDAVVIAIGNLNEFVDTYSAAGKPMRTEDRRALRSMVAYANQRACRLCNECMCHCPENLLIADIFRYERYALDYKERRRARRLYAELEKQADACTNCGDCLTHCPQRLPVSTKLAEVHRLLG